MKTQLESGENLTLKMSRAIDYYSLATLSLQK